MNHPIIATAMVVFLLFTGCKVHQEELEEMQRCKENMIDLSCDELLKCDALCEVVQEFPAGQRNCHISFANQVRARCG